MGIEAVESRVLLSVDPVSEVAGAISNPDGGADLSTQITTYSDESTDLAEGYALDVEEAYLDTTQAELESEMQEFFVEASEAAAEYDPYAGLDETPVAEYLSDYDDELTNLESSASSGSSTQDATADYSGSYSTSVGNNGVADVSGQGQSSGLEVDQAEGGSIFDYDNQISSYAEQIIANTLTESSSGGGEAGTEAGTEAGSEGSNGGTGESSSAGASDSAIFDSSPVPLADNTLTADAPDEFVNPFVVPEGLVVSGVELPDEVSGDVDLLTVTPLRPGSYTTVTAGEVALTVKPVDDPELGTGDQTSLAEATLTTTQTWASPFDWEIKYTLESSFSIITQTTDNDGVSHGEFHTGGSTTTITIFSTGTSIFSYTAVNSVTTTQEDGWDDSDITLGTVDTGGYLATYTVSSTLAFTSTDTLVTLSDGSPGRTTDVYFSLTDSNSASFDASYQLYEATGTLEDYRRCEHDETGIHDPDCGITDNSIKHNDTDHSNIKPGVIRKPGGHGEKLDASGGFNVYGSTTGTTWIDSSATYPDGGEIQDSDITGTAGFDTTLISGGGVSQSIDYDSQDYSGIPGTDSEVYEYISLSFNDSASGNTTTTVNASFDVDDPASTTSTTTTATRALTSTSTSSPSTDGIDGASVTHNDDGSTTFSLLVDIKTPREYQVGSTTDWTQFVTTIDLQMTVTAKFGMGVFLDASGLPAGGITGNGTMKGTSSITYTHIDEHDPMNWVSDDWVVTTDISNWQWYQTQKIVADGNWTFGVGVTLAGAPTVTGSWDGTLNYVFIDGSKSYTEFQKFRASDSVWVSEWSEAEEKGVWTYDMTGKASGSGGQIKHLTSVEWTTTSTGSPPQVEPPLNKEWNENLDNIQTVLDIAGMVPVIGEGADMLNLAINVGRGKWGDAVLSGAAMIPFAGAFATGGKYLKKAAGKVDDVGTALTKNAGELKDAGTALTKNAGEVKMAANCFIAGTQVVVATSDDVIPIDIPLPEELVVEPVVDDNSSTTAAFMGAGVAIALARHNLKTRRHRRRLLSRKLASSETPPYDDFRHEDR